MAYESRFDPAVQLRVMELYAETKNKSKVAEIIQKEFSEFNGLSCDALRKRISRFILNDGAMKKTGKIEKKIVDKFVLSAWNGIGGSIMNIDEYCEAYNLPREDIKDYKLVTHTGTPYYNIHFKENISNITDVIDLEFIDEIVQKHISMGEYNLKTKNPSDKVIRAIYTDTHIGMSPNPEGFSLFGGVWNEKELTDRLRIFCSDIISKALRENSATLIIDDLGDFMDGWEGSTVRKGHDLPQNMTSTEAFDVGIKFKVLMVDMLVDSGVFSSITLHNICNDNHAGSFGYIVSSAFKSIVEAKHGIVEVINYRKFINHYLIGSHCFMISHGKDDKHLKFGFKPYLDDKQVSKIDQYMKSNDLYYKAEYFEFSKGDSHQMVFDYSTSDDFNYMNYPAFSPSSDWVQTNYKKGSSGYVIQIIDPHSEEIDVSHHLFKWKK